MKINFLYILIFSPSFIKTGCPDFRERRAASGSSGTNGTDRYIWQGPKQRLELHLPRSHPFHCESSKILGLLPGRETYRKCCAFYGKISAAKIMDKATIQRPMELPPRHHNLSKCPDASRCVPTSSCSDYSDCILGKTSLKEWQ